MIDTHAHLDFESYDIDRANVIDRCREKLAAVITIGVDEKTSQAAIQLAVEQNFVYAAVGFHPEESGAYLKKGKTIHDLIKIVEMLVSKSKKVVAIGEIGLDYHYKPLNDAEKQIQQEIFEGQLQLALSLNLPIIIHSRDAFQDTLTIVQKYRPLKGVWHSFTEGVSAAQDVLATGLFIGINGIVTFPSAHEVKKALRVLSLEHLVLETDAPFLAPLPHRGERNEPWMVELVAQEVASLKECTIQEVEKATDTNAKKLFFGNV